MNTVVILLSNLLLILVRQQTKSLSNNADTKLYHMGKYCVYFLKV